MDGLVSIFLDKVATKGETQHSAGNPTTQGVDQFELKFRVPQPTAGGGRMPKAMKMRRWERLGIGLLLVAGSEMLKNPECPADQAFQ